MAFWFLSTLRSSRSTFSTSNLPALEFPVASAILFHTAVSAFRSLAEWSAPDASHHRDRAECCAPVLKAQDRMDPARKSADFCKRQETFPSAGPRSLPVP